jgi:ubiquitin-small subunit ribosomal protein S27Ae
MSKKESGDKKAKKKATGIGSYYQIEGKTLKRLRPSCERCGRGYFMADHGDRFTCGHCGLTRYKQQE